VHRNDPPDASHSPMFHQIEGLAVDANITFGDLKGTLRSRDERVFWVEREDEFSSVVFSVHRAERGDVCFVLHLRRERETRRGAVPSVQANWMD